MPWLMERVEEQLNKSVLGRTVLDGILREVVTKRQEDYKKLEQSQQAPTPSAGEEQEEQPQQPTIAVEGMQLQEEVRMVEEGELREFIDSSCARSSM